MSKIVFKYWIVNLFVGLLLYVAYRIVIQETDFSSEGFLGAILAILELLANLGYSLLFLGGAIICSLPIFLNSNKKVRDKKVLSFLSFVGIPLIFLLGLVTIYFIDFYPKTLHSFDRNLLVFSLIYTLFTAIQYLMFRKGIENN